MTPEQIAKGLTSKDRAWLLNPARLATDIYHGHEMAKRGLCSHSGWPIRATPLGLAVRAILEKQDDQ